VKKLVLAIAASSLAFAGMAGLSTGCGGSSGNGADASTESGEMDSGMDVNQKDTGGKDTGNDTGNDSGKDTGPGCQTLPEFVTDLVTNHTNSKDTPIAIPTCDQWPQLTPTGTAKPSMTDPQTATEFKPLL